MQKLKPIECNRLNRCIRSLLGLLSVVALLEKYIWYFFLCAEIHRPKLLWFSDLTGTSQSPWAALYCNRFWNCFSQSCSLREDKNKPVDLVKPPLPINQHSMFWLAFKEDKGKQCSKRRRCLPIVDSIPRSLSTNILPACWVEQLVGSSSHWRMNNRFLATQAPVW
jgi:hypothetical protein